MSWEGSASAWKALDNYTTTGVEWKQPVLKAPFCCEKTIYHDRLWTEMRRAEKGFCVSAAEPLTLKLEATFAGRSLAVWKSVLHADDTGISSGR